MTEIKPNIDFDELTFSNLIPTLRNMISDFAVSKSYIMTNKSDFIRKAFI